MPATMVAAHTFASTPSDRSSAAALKDSFSAWTGKLVKAGSVLYSYRTVHITLIDASFYSLYH